MNERLVAARTVPIAPFGKARPRVTRNGTFMPKKYQKQCRDLRLMFGPVPDGLVHLSVTAVRAMPKSWSRKRRAEMAGCYAKPKPDIDNIVGGILDSLFDEDDRVVSIFAEKIWGEEAQLTIEIRELYDD